MDRTTVTLVGLWPNFVIKWIVYGVLNDGENDRNSSHQRKTEMHTGLLPGGVGADPTSQEKTYHDKTSLYL